MGSASPSPLVKQEISGRHLSTSLAHELRATEAADGTGLAGGLSDGQFAPINSIRLPHGSAV